jgi:hypothetical protein
MILWLEISSKQTFNPTFQGTLYENLPFLKQGPNSLRSESFGKLRLPPHQKSLLLRPRCRPVTYRDNSSNALPAASLHSSLHTTNIGSKKPKMQLNIIANETPSFVQAAAERRPDLPVRTLVQTHQRNSKLDWETARREFREKTAEGPVYACTCCQQLWFRRSVCRLDPARLLVRPSQAFSQKMVSNTFALRGQSTYRGDPPCSPSKIPDSPPLPPKL